MRMLLSVRESFHADRLVNREKRVSSNFFVRLEFENAFNLRRFVPVEFLSDFPFQRN